MTCQGVLSPSQLPVLLTSPALRCFGFFLPVELVAAIGARDPGQARKLAAEQIRRAEMRIAAAVSAANPGQDS
jgi:hypothetical protein